MKIFCTLIFLILSSVNSFAANHSLTIVTSINPLYQISKFISGERNKIILLVDSAVSEHDYMPKPSDIRNINNADLIFYISNDLEYYLPKILKSTNNKALMVELINSEGLKLLRTNNKTDPHIWLNPKNAIIIAQEIAKNLSALDPSGTDIYSNNLKKFINEVNSDDKKIKSGFSKIKKINYLIYHNCYRYFEDYYGLNSSKTINDSQNVQFSIGNIKKINEVIENNNLECLIAQPQEETRVPLEIANSKKVKFVIADIIGSRYEDKNGYIKLIDELVLKFKSCIIFDNDN